MSVTGFKESSLPITCCSKSACGITEFIPHSEEQPENPREASHYFKERR